MPKDYFDEYLVTIKPDIDQGLWNKATGSIRGHIENALFGPVTKKLDALRKKLSELTEKRKGIAAQLAVGKDTEGKVLTDEQKESLKTQLKGLDESIGTAKTEIEGGSVALSKLSGNFATAGAIMTVYIAVVKSAIETAKKVIEKSKDISKQFVSQSSIQVDTGVRDIMGKFGVDSSTALSISTAADTLGYDINEYSKWSVAQREAFAELMRDYQSGIDAIDPKKLEDYNKAVQEYELTWAKFQVRMKVAITDLFASSEGFRNLLKTVETALDSIATILENDAIKTGFDLLMGIIDGILKFATAPLNWLGSLMGGGSTTNNKSVSVTNNINTTNGVDSSQLAVDIGLSVRNAMS